MSRIRSDVRALRTIEADAASSLSSVPSSSATNAEPPVGANAMPKGCDANGNVIVCETVIVDRIDHADRGRVLVRHPDLAVRRDGERARPRADRDFRESRVVRGVEHGTELLSWFTTQSIRHCHRTRCCSRSTAVAVSGRVDDLRDRLATAPDSVRRRRHGDVVDAGRAEGVRDRR